MLCRSWRVSADVTDVRAHAGLPSSIPVHFKHAADQPRHGQFRADERAACRRRRWASNLFCFIKQIRPQQYFYQNMLLLTKLRCLIKTNVSQVSILV